MENLINLDEYRAIWYYCSNICSACKKQHFSICPKDCKKKKLQCSKCGKQTAEIKWIASDKETNKPLLMTMKEAKEFHDSVIIEVDKEIEQEKTTAKIIQFKINAK